MANTTNFFNISPTDSEQQIIQFFCQLFEAIPNVFFVKNMEGQYLYVNEEFETFIGRKKIEILGHTDYDLMTESQAEDCRKSDELPIAQPNQIHTSFELEKDNNDAIKSYISVNKQVVDTVFGQVLLGVVTKVAIS